MGRTESADRGGPTGHGVQGAPSEGVGVGRAESVLETLRGLARHDTGTGEGRKEREGSRGMGLREVVGDAVGGRAPRASP